MKKLVLILLAGCSVTLPSRCLAKLGETEAQLDARFGKPFHTLDDGRRFYAVSENVQVVVRFQVRAAQAISVFEVYSKRDHSKMSLIELAHLLRLDGGITQWQPKAITYSGGGIIQWRSIDNKQTAYYNEISKTLVVATIDALKKDREKNGPAIGIFKEI